jgi:hypothetical protein
MILLVIQLNRNKLCVCSKRALVSNVVCMCTAVSRDLEVSAAVMDVEMIRVLHEWYDRAPVSL